MPTKLVIFVPVDCEEKVGVLMTPSKKTRPRPMSEQMLQAHSTGIVSNEERRDGMSFSFASSEFLF